MIKIFPCGLLDTNTYVVWDENSLNGLIIDCGVEPHVIMKFIEERNINIKYVVLTHGHVDHAEFAEDYEKAFPEAKIICHEKELCVLLDVEANLSGWGKRPREYKCNYQTVKEGDVLTLGYENSDTGCLAFEILHTPGHTPGCICLYDRENQIMFTGDTLFRHSYGRTDFKHGNSQELFASLRRLLSLDPQITFYPGHYDKSTIGSEKGFFIF